MKDQDPVGDPAAAVGPARARGVPGGITGKIAAIVAALLAVFIVSATGLILQVKTLSTVPVDITMLDNAHHTSLQALVEFKEQILEFHEVLGAGTNAQLRKQHLEAFQANSALVETLLSQTAAQVPPGSFRDEVKRFLADHAAMTPIYSNALNAFQASGGRDAAAAETAVRDLENERAFLRFEDATNKLDVEVARLFNDNIHRVDQRVTVIVIVGIVLLLALAFTTAVVIRRVVSPIRQLTLSAERISQRQLPEAVAKVRAMREGDEPPTLEPIVVTSRDETANLAGAFHSLQTSALSLAIDQHKAEQEAAEMLVNLGRRNQNLLNRTLAYITELEQTEQNPEVLDRLFRLDHATTRIRRNAESMLVLAGAHQTRTWSVPAAAVDVVRAALSEIEDYNRVDIYHVQDAAISGSAIADVVHLLAELVENAATFSPPATKVTVVGQMVPEGYRIRVIDEGIGMTRSELDASNRIIRLATEGRSASKLLGLYVVGRLAARRGIDVTLEASGGRGVTANVVLPRGLLAESPARGEAPPAAPALPAAEPVRNGHRAAATTASMPVPMPAPAPVPAAQVPVPAPAPIPVAQLVGRPESQPNGAVRRIPGAQLPDLGPFVDESPALASVDAVDVRGRLSSLQAGVRAGREVAGVADPDVEAAGVADLDDEISGAEALDDEISDAEAVAVAGTDVEAVDVESTDVEVTEGLPEPVPVEQGVEAVDVEAAVEAAESAAVPMPAPSEPEVPAVPVRVPGAQLPDLGLMENDPDTYLAPPSMASRWTLRSFQLDVDAARRIENPDAIEPVRNVGRTPEES